MISARRAAGRAALCLAALVGASCAPPLMKLPSGPGSPAADANDALAEATSACRQVKTLTAEVAASGTMAGGKIRGRLLIGISALASVRIEAVAPFGAPLFIFAANGDEGTLLLPRDDRFVARAPAATLLEAVAGVPLGPADLRGIMTGCAVDARSVLAGDQLGEDWRRIRVEAMTDLYLHRDRGWRLVAMLKMGSGALRVEYGDFDGDLPRAIRLTASATAGARSGGYDLRLMLSQVEVNGPIDVEAFSLRVPPTAAPITIDELRRSGPLSRPSPKAE
jgi:hypothetical protein